jgi:hypothetical protein
MVRKNILRKSKNHKKNKNLFMKRTLKKILKGGIFPEEGRAPTKSEISQAKKEFLLTNPPQIFSKNKKQEIIPHSNILGYNKPINKIVNQEFIDDDWISLSPDTSKLTTQELPKGYNIDQSKLKTKWDRKTRKIQRDRKLQEHFAEQAALNLIDTNFFEKKPDHRVSVVIKKNKDYESELPHNTKEKSKLRKLFENVRKTLKRKQKTPDANPNLEWLDA